MKLQAIIKAPGRFLSREDSIWHVGSPKLFDDMEAAGWIKPVVQKTRYVLYDVRALDAACDRVGQGEYPGENQ